MKNYIMLFMIIGSGFSYAADSRYDIDHSQIDWTVSATGDSASGSVYWDHTSGDAIFGSSFTTTISVTNIDTSGYFFTVGVTGAGGETLELGGPWVPSGTVDEIWVDFDTSWSVVPTTAAGYSFVGGEWNQVPAIESYKIGTGSLGLLVGTGNGSLIENDPLNGGVLPDYGLLGGVDINAGARMKTLSTSWSNSGSESINLGGMNGFVEFDQVPEPGSALLMAIGSSFIIFRRRRVA